MRSPVALTTTTLSEQLVNDSVQEREDHDASTQELNRVPHGIWNQLVCHEDYERGNRMGAFMEEMPQRLSKKPLGFR